VSYQNANGIVDKVIGLVREVAGELLNKKSWIEAGEAQQTKGSEKLRALRAQAEADAHAVKAKTAAGRQRSARESKAS
jgi:hypothetical protein